MSVTDFFDRGWRANPTGAAFIAGERSYTYDEIGNLSCRVGNALLARGVGREVKGAVLAGNDPLAWPACWVCGGRYGLGARQPLPARPTRSTPSGRF
jgi:acyl-CoA synthetase (AMP-forming)/AMP-acid ligase II